MDSPAYRCSFWRKLFVGLATAKTVGLAASLACVGFLFSGCSQSEAGTGSQRPTRLRIGWTPGEEEPERRMRFEGLCNYLSQRLKMPVEMIQTGTYSAQIEAFRARKIEIGSLSPFSYVIAHEKARVEPLTVRGKPSGEHSVYRSVLIVPPNSPLRTIEDVKANASKLTLAWVDPASTSGHLIPRAYLESIGMNPEKDFKQVIFTQSHLATAMTIKSGKVDIAASMNTGLKRLVEKGRIQKDDFRILWQSEGIISDVNAVRSDLSDAFKEEVRQAYTDFAKAEPAAWAKFSALFPDPTLVWVPAHDSDFDELRRIARSVKHIQLLE